YYRPCRNYPAGYKTSTQNPAGPATYRGSPAHQPPSKTVPTSAYADPAETHQPWYTHSHRRSPRTHRTRPRPWHVADVQESARDYTAPSAQSDSYPATKSGHQDPP